MAHAVRSAASAHRGAQLAGFVNVAGDGGVHAFILDTVVAGPLRPHGVGTGLVEVAAREAAARAAVTASASGSPPYRAVSSVTASGSAATRSGPSRAASSRAAASPLSAADLRGRTTHRPVGGK